MKKKSKQIKKLIVRIFVLQEASPLLTKCATVGVLCATGDAISQAVAQPTLLRGQGRYDFARTARMAVFGCVISVKPATVHGLLPNPQKTMLGSVATCVVRCAGARCARQRDASQHHQSVSDRPLATPFRLNLAPI
jgi:hypothetical protein